MLLQQPNRKYALLYSLAGGAAETVSRCEKDQQASVGVSGGGANLGRRR